MKSAISILFVAFMFAAFSLLAAQKQTSAPPNVAPAVASPAAAVPSGVATEPRTTSGEQQLVTTSPPASKSPEPGRLDSENKPVREGNPDPAQNLIEYGGPG